MGVHPDNSKVVIIPKPMRYLSKITLLLFLLFAITSCNYPGKRDNLSDQEIRGTSAARTIEALIESTAPPLVLDTREPTITGETSPIKTLSVIKTAGPSSTSVPLNEDCNRVKFVDDVTVPDGTVMEAGKTFIKTWRLENAGSCTWTTGYDLVYMKGERMDATISIPFAREVGPGEEIDVSVTMTAPDNPGSYEGRWMLRNEHGQNFGLGKDADKEFWVRIKVLQPTSPPFAVISAQTSVQPTVFSGGCPHVFNFTSKIETTGPGKVTYYWQRSDGYESQEKSIEFDSADEISINHSWQIGSSGNSYTEWARIYINEPNHQFFNKANLELDCDP